MEQIKLDLIPGKTPPTCHASQYDVGRTIRLNLVEDGSDYTIPASTTAEIHIRKPDNNIISAAVTATPNNKYIDIVTAEQWTACAGTNLCEIVLTNGGNVIGTINFILEVEMDPIDGGTASESVIYNIQALVDTALANSSLVNLPIHLVEGTTTDADLAQALRDAFANNQDVLGYATISGTTTSIYCRSTSASTDRFMAIHYLLTGVLGDKVYTFEVVVGSNPSDPYIDVSKTVEEKGKFTIHITGTTMTESAADILAALSDGKELQVIYQPDSGSLTTYTLPLTMDSGARPDGLRALSFAGLWDSRLYAADILLDSVHSTVTSLSTTNGKDLGGFAIHINENTMVESVSSILAALSRGETPYVLYKSDNSLDAVVCLGLDYDSKDRLDLDLRTLVFSALSFSYRCYRIEIYIKLSTSTLQSLNITSDTLGAIKDSSTSSFAVWSSNKTATEIANKTEIDDTAVSSSSAWSSSRIASFLPTDTAQGAIANFPDGADDVPVDSLVADIDYKDTTGFNVFNVTHTGKNFAATTAIEKGTATESSPDGTPYSDMKQSNSKRARVSTIIAIPYGEQITLSCAANYKMFYFGFDRQGLYNGMFTPSSNWANPVTVTKNMYFVAVVFKRNDEATITDADLEAINLQIETGASATAYDSTGEQKTVNLGGMIYGGSVDITNGIVTSTKAQDGSDLPDPVVTTITPTAINSLKGVNNIWADTGDVSVEYRADVQLYIDKKLAALNNNRGLSLSKNEPEEVKEEEKQEGDESLTR